MKRIYLDHAATTPVDPRVLEAMRPYFSEKFGNASSVHRFGLEAKSALETARMTIANSVHARPQEVIFTSGGTEANNLAILGVCRTRKQPAHLITSAIEHPSVLQVHRFLESQGWQVSYLPVNAAGCVEPESLAKAIRRDTALISIMHANNETGMVQPIAALAAIAAEATVPFHTDAVQAYGKLDVDCRLRGLSLLTLSSHKIYGPKGAGALILRAGCKIRPALQGGRQESGRRPGTENLPAIVGFARAAELQQQKKDALCAHLRQLTDALMQFIAEEIPGAHLNGAGPDRVPGLVNYSFPGTDSLSLLMRLDRLGFAVSNGSACSSGQVEPSHVLRAMRLPPRIQNSAVRFSFGRENTLEEVQALQAALLETI